MAISEEAAKTRREYYRKYRQENKDRINEKNRQRYHADPNKYKSYQQSYWERKVDNPQLREAYEKIFPKFMAAPIVEKKKKYWKVLHKLGEWELNEVEELKAALERNWKAYHGNTEPGADSYLDQGYPF